MPERIQLPSLGAAAGGEEIFPSPFTVEFIALEYVVSANSTPNA